MPIDIFCEACQKKLRVPDTAAGKRIKCPKCQGVLSVPSADTAAPTAPQASSHIPTPSKMAASKSSAAISVPTPTPTPTPNVTPGSKIVAKPKAENWFVQTEEGEQYGPVTREELDAWYAEGRITLETQLLLEGGSQWQWASDIFPELNNSAAAPAADTAAGGFPAFGEMAASSSAATSGTGAFNFGEAKSGTTTSSVASRGKSKKGGKSGGKRGGSPHIDYIAYCEYAMGGLGILMCVILLMMGGAAAAALSGVKEEGAAQAAGAVGGIVTFIAIFGMLISCIWFVAAYGMQQRASWGRLLTLILAILGAISLSPLNIAFAVWCYMVLTDKDNQAAFR